MTTQTERVSDERLLPCPHCGASKAMMFEPTCRPETPYNPADRLFPIVRCMTCYAEAAGEDEDYKGQSAIAAWNRRASPAPAESREPVAWLRTERPIYDGVPGRTYTTNDPELAELWRLNDYTESLVPLYAHPPAESAGSPSTSGVGVPDGWVLVPREPTEAMKREGVSKALSVQLSAGYTWPDYMADLWATMLSAAPSDPSRDTQPALLSTDETKEGGNG